MKKIIDKRYPATSALLLISSLIFVLMFLTSGWNYTSSQTVFQFGGMYGEIVRVLPSQLWRLISAIFVHIGLEHFAMNMLSLYFLGRQIEMIFGSKNFLLIYLMSGAMGNLFVYFFSPNVVAAGASTSLFGLFATVILLRYVVKNPYIQALGQSYTSLLVINLIMSFLPGVSLAGHLGGAVGGALCAVIFPIRSEENAFRPSQRLLALVAYFLLAIGLIVLGMLGN